MAAATTRAQAETDHEQLAAEIARRLGGRSVATAESVTAGRIAESLATVDGATDFLRGGLVAYQEPVKRALLGVVADSVLSPGAAAQMASGAADLFGAEVTVATTGVAGRDAQDGQPGGTVLIATHVDGRVDVNEHHFAGSPIDVCEQARRQALADLLHRLDDDGVQDSRGERPPHRPDAPPGG